ncbi:MAG: hypothetical protein KAF64_20220 [Hydrogenophaga sp.]|uniref:hypothetical protein n=1 Tax=Hydrogenophaga sp. TaxID=1904254 RepID=UPI0025C518EA|nr:hypothetical protein [Hydrogenophaga sp.]MBU7575697.1 hypothetical protein [Hydrogenophaga sp.]
MARSSIQGTSPAPPQPAGRDTASLGPGDSSDSGSDMMGIADDDGGDPNAPADFDTRDEPRPTLLSPDALASPSDAAGTGESRSAGGDGGKRDGWDIGVDQVITPEGTDAASDDEDPDLAFIDDAEAGDPLSDEGLDESEEDGAAPPRPPSPKAPKA